MKKEYREIQKKKLFDKEFALLPETVYYVDLINKNNKLKEKRRELEREMEAFRVMICDIDVEISANRAEIYGERPRKHNYETNGPCPKNDCLGFIMKRNNKCGVCETKICKGCREIIEGENIHECKPENIESAKLIAKDSKPCPKCAVFIFKIDGCDQMWCSNCRTAFSWLSGEIEKGRVHNPHYYDWLRKTSNGGDIPREPDDNCNDLITLSRLDICIRYQPDDLKKNIYVAHRQVVHVSNTCIDQLRTIVRENSDNKQLRIKYLMQIISKNEFQIEIEKRDRIIRKTNSILDCLTLFYDVMRDAFRVLCDNVSHYQFKVFMEDFIKNYEMISEFTNQNIEKVEKIYSCSLSRYKIQ